MYTYIYIYIYINKYIYIHTHTYIIKQMLCKRPGVYRCVKTKKSRTKQQKYRDKNLLVILLSASSIFYFFILFYFTLRKGSLSACCMCWCIFSSGSVVYFSMLIYVFLHIEIWRHAACTGCRKPIGCLKLQVIFRKRATNSRTLLRKMTYEDKALYDSTPPCNISCWVNFFLVCILSSWA